MKLPVAKCKICKQKYIISQPKLEIMLGIKPPKIIICEKCEEKREI